MTRFGSALTATVLTVAGLAGLGAGGFALMGNCPGECATKTAATTHADVQNADIQKVSLGEPGDGCCSKDKAQKASACSESKTEQVSLNTEPGEGCCASKTEKASTASGCCAGASKTEMVSLAKADPNCTDPEGCAGGECPMKAAAILGVAVDGEGCCAAKTEKANAASGCCAGDASKTEMVALKADPNCTDPEGCAGGECPMKAAAILGIAVDGEGCCAAKTEQVSASSCCSEQGAMAFVGRFPVSFRPAVFAMPLSATQKVSLEGDCSKDCAKDCSSTCSDAEACTEKASSCEGVCPMTGAKVSPVSAAAPATSGCSKDAGSCTEKAASGCSKDNQTAEGATETVKVTPVSAEAGKSCPLCTGKKQTAGE